MRLAILMPRGTDFSRARATSIDTCVYDFARTSRHAVTVYGPELTDPFPGVRYVGVAQPTGFA
ncbi:MAG: hypothetical protein RL291_1373, partial [Pseudomonadota bacterium]